MDDDWEQLAEKDNVVIAPKVPNINKWEGEDEDDDVKESWEDEEEKEEKKDEEKIKEEVKPTKVKPKKSVQPKSDKEKDKVDTEEKLEREKIESMTPEEKIAEKLRLQKIQQEEDLKAALDTFGVTEPPSGLDGLHPTTKSEFSEFAQAISDKVSVYRSSEEFPGFVEELVRSICANLSASDLRKIKLTVENLHLEKQKLEKEKAKKPSGKSKTKVKLRVEEDNVKSNNIGDYGYGYDDDYDDFM